MFRCCSLETSQPLGFYFSLFSSAHFLEKRGLACPYTVFFRDWNSNFCVSTRITYTKISPQSLSPGSGTFLYLLPNLLSTCKLPSVCCWILGCQTPLARISLLALLEPCFDYTPLCRNTSVPSLLDAKHCSSEQSIHSWAIFTLHWPHIE